MAKAPAGDWYAVKIPVPRTGRTEIIYVQAKNREVAGDIDPGAVVLGGPYPSPGDAQRAAPQGSSGSTKSATGVAPTENALPQPLPNPLDALAEIGHWIGAFVTDITDVYMWISLGWIFLGLLLLIVGLMWLLKKTGIIPQGGGGLPPIPVPV